MQTKLLALLLMLLLGEMCYCREKEIHQSGTGFGRVVEQLLRNQQTGGNSCKHALLLFFMSLIDFKEYTKTFTVSIKFIKEYLQRNKPLETLFSVENQNRVVERVARRGGMYQVEGRTPRLPCRRRWWRRC